VTTDLPRPQLHRTGGGPPVVLLHPLGVDHSVWSPVQTRLERFTLLGYDLPGHGRTAVPASRYTVDDLAEQLAGLLDEQAVGAAHVVGVSLGGLVAQALAARRPDLVDHLVVVDAVDVYPPPMRSMWQDRAALVRAEGTAPVVEPTLELWFSAEAREAGAQVVDTVRGLLLATDPEGYARACEALQTADTSELLASIRATTLVVCGEYDAPAFTAAAPRLADTVPNARLVWLPGARHAGALEQPEAFAGLLADFLSGAVPD